MIRVTAGQSGLRRHAGFTLMELLITATIAGLIVAGLGAVIRASVETKVAVDARLALMQDAQFAMDRMVFAVSGSRRLLLPLNDNPATGWPEHIREQTVPASPPIGGSTLATAVLAVTLPAYVDLDFDGFPDADDDRDGQIDEDLPYDNHHDFVPGISLIDDDGDGLFDEGFGWAQDDEDGSSIDEDPLDGMDNDGDGSIDEDPGSDNSADGCPGLCGVDDDGDGQIDEGSDDDDDEDGSTFDDPYDPVVFFVNDSAVMERMPVPWNEDGITAPDGPVDGRDFVVSTIAEGVTRFRIERVPAPGGGLPLVDITLELTSVFGETVSLNRRVRVGGML